MTVKKSAPQYTATNCAASAGAGAPVSSKAVPALLAAANAAQENAKAIRAIADALRGSSGGNMEYGFFFGEK